MLYAVELFVERCLHGVVYLYGIKHFALLGMVANGKHAHYAVSLHHLGAFHYVV